MLETLHTLLAPAATQRLTLLLNHVLASEPVALQRLKAHTGRRIGLQLSPWPAWLPPPPALVFEITRAGLLERLDVPSELPPDLQVQADLSNPALAALRLLGGERPAIHVQGDARLAADVQWLAEHLRWDVVADLEPLFGPAAAEQLGRVGTAVVAGMRRLAEAGGDLAARAGGLGARGSAR